jgi:hypothetical protein
VEQQDHSRAVSTTFQTGPPLCEAVKTALLSVAEGTWLKPGVNEIARCDCGVAIYFFVRWATHLASSSASLPLENRMVAASAW